MNNFVLIMYMAQHSFPPSFIFLRLNFELTRFQIQVHLFTDMPKKK